MSSPPHSNLILIDFDHTVFNTTDFVTSLKDVLAEYGISEEEFNEQREAVKNCCQVIDIDRFISKLSYDNPAELHEVIKNAIAETAHQFIFPDVHDFFERHKDRYKIMLLTHGDHELQSLKIQSSKLPKYVDFVISLDSKGEVGKEFVERHGEVYFFDDKAENIDDMKTMHPTVHTYFVQRPEDMPYSDVQSECDCADEEITDLTLNLP